MSSLKCVESIASQSHIAYITTVCFLTTVTQSIFACIGTLQGTGFIILQFYLLHTFFLFELLCSRWTNLAVQCSHVGALRRRIIQSAARKS